MSIVLGKNVIVYIYDGGLWKPAVCGLTCSYSTNAEDIETSITGAGPWRTFKYAGLTWGGSIDGAMSLQQVNTLAVPDIRAIQYNRQAILMRYQRTDTVGNVYTEEGTALLINITDNGDNTGVATFSIQFKGTGAPTPIFTPTPINPFGKVKRTSTFTAIGGETSHVFSELIGKDLLEVSIDTRDMSVIITTGTPVENEVKFTVASGLITFPMELNPGVQVYCMYQDI